MTRRSWLALVMLLLLASMGVTHASHAFDAPDDDDSVLTSACPETACDFDVPASPIIFADWVYVSAFEVVVHDVVRIERSAKVIALAPKTSPPRLA